MKKYRISVIPYHPNERREYECSISVVPVGYDGTGPQPRFTERFNLPRMLTRLGIPEDRRDRIVKDILNDKSHFIAETEVPDPQVKEFWWEEE